MTKLARTSHGESNVSRRQLLGLAVASLFVCAIPTLQGAAEPSVQPEQKAVQKPKPTRIIMHVALGPTDPNDQTTRFFGLVAIDPETGKFEKLGIENGHSYRISPDGQTIAYATKNAIWTDNLNGTSPGKILDFSGRPIWSPNGKEIVVSHGEIIREEDEKEKPEKPVWKVETWRCNDQGDNAYKISVPETDFVDDWSPDGKWFVTSSDRHAPFGSGYQLYLMRPDGSEERRLTKVRGLNVYARFSPDSRHIAYLHQRGANNIHVIDIDGKNDHAVYRENGGMASPGGVCWSPDGKQLAFAVYDWQIDEKGKKVLRADQDANYRIVIIDADGKNQRELKLDTLARIFMISDPQWR